MAPARWKAGLLHGARFGVGAALGALSALGRPGGDVLLLHLGALLVLLAYSSKAPSYLSVFVASAGFGCGDGIVSSASSVSWGLAVPVTLTCILALTHQVPLALWTRLACRWPEGGPRFLATISVAGLLAQLGELIGFPSKLATAFVTPLPEAIAGARLVGADLVTGLLAATSVEVAITLAQGWRSVGDAVRVLRAAVPGALTLGGLSILAYLSAPPAARNVQVGVPQINADSSYYQSRLLAPAVAERFDRTFEQLLLALEPAELLVTTEAYDGRFGLTLSPVRAAWAERSRRLGQAAVVTSYLVDAEGGKRNGAGVFDVSGRFLGVHEKVTLAPFGETPLTAGTEYRVFEALPGVRLGVAICLEPYLRRPGLELVRSGAELIAATTSDVTFGSSILVFEHLAMARVRAIELGRSIVWASNAGPSGVIGRFGEFEGSPFRKATAVRALAHTYAGQTPFVRFFELWSALPALGLLGALLFRRGKTSPAPLPTPPGPSFLASLGLGALGLVVTALLVPAAPGWVELRRGDPARFRLAMAELGQPVPTFSAPDPYARFRSEPDRSASSAIAYFLEYHGLGQLPDLDLPPWASWEDVRTTLQRHGIETRELDLTRHEPRAAALLRFKDGTWGVADSQEDDTLRLIAPHTGRAGDVDAAQVVQLVEPRGLIPTFSASEGQSLEAPRRVVYP